jgi:hypothetical protein
LADLEGGASGEQGEFRPGGMMLDGEKVEGQEGVPIAELPLHAGTTQKVVY